MKSFAAMFFSAFFCFAWSASSSASAEDCLSLLEGSIRASDTRALRCFEKDATWQDESGTRRGKGAVSDGLKAFLAHSTKLPEGGLRRIVVSSTALVAGPYAGDEYGFLRYYVFALEPSTGPWKAVRLYQGARPWPDAAPAGTTAPDPIDLRSGTEAFNVRFASGDVAGWMSFWRPDAVFVSIIGPFAGDEVRMFFENQAKRYEGLSFTVDRDLTGPGTSGAVIEGAIRGRCRSNGSPFMLPFVMLIRYQAHKTSFVYEAFTVHDDGCGPFWTIPR